MSVLMMITIKESASGGCLMTGLYKCLENI